MRCLNTSSSALIPPRSGIAPSPRVRIDMGDGEQSTDAVRYGIVYFANPDLDGLLSQFDASGAEQGSSSVQDLFAQLENKLTQ